MPEWYLEPPRGKYRATDFMPCCTRNCVKHKKSNQSTLYIGMMLRCNIYMQYSWNYEVDFSSPTGLGSVDGTTVLGKLNLNYIIEIRDTTEQ